MFSITLFRSAGTTGHVFTYSGGQARDRGIGWSGLLGPATTVSVIPTTVQVVSYAVEGYTSDRQQARVSGSVQVTFDPAVARSAFDFTVSRTTGGYASSWQNDLQAAIVNQILSPIRRVAAGLTVDRAVVSQSEFEAAIQDSMGVEDGPHTRRGIQIQACSVGQVAPSVPEVQKAIGAKEREALLSEADAAVFERRRAAAVKERDLKSYEAQTKLELERERAALVEQEGQNQIAAAGAEAQAATIRFGPLKELAPEQLIGAALMEAAGKGSLTNLALTTDLLALLRGETKPA